MATYIRFLTSLQGWVSWVIYTAFGPPGDKETWESPSLVRGRCSSNVFYGVHGSMAALGFFLPLGSPHFLASKCAQGKTKNPEPHGDSPFPSRRCVFPVLLMAS